MIQQIRILHGLGERMSAARLSVDYVDLGTIFDAVRKPERISPQKNPLTESESGFFLLVNGRGERIRTSDPHNPIVVRYQAALRPDRTANANRSHVYRAAMIRAVVV